ncbi:Rib/alpha-like domain-containing protein [Staphylococcus aureus]|nr:Rib/alpha-like domain-containing protein [Staphylococcus aureus]
MTSKTVSNVSRTGNNANVTVTVTYQDGTTSTVTVPVKACHSRNRCTFALHCTRPRLPSR